MAALSDIQIPIEIDPISKLNLAAESQPKEHIKKHVMLLKKLLFLSLEKYYR